MWKFLSFIILSLQGGFGLYAQSPGSFPTKPEVIFVQGGTFTMGSNQGGEDEQPVHRVRLSDFSIGKYEVTVSQYRAFCVDSGRKMPEEPTWGWNDNEPIVHVSYLDAVATVSGCLKSLGALGGCLPRPNGNMLQEVGAKAKDTPMREAMTWKRSVGLCTTPGINPIPWVPKSPMNWESMI